MHSAPAQGPAREPTTPAPRLRLLLITDTSIQDTGGSERFLRGLLHGLGSERYRIDVVQLGRAPGTAPAEADSAGFPGIRFEQLPIGAAYGLRAWRVYREMRHRVLRGEYDIVQSQHEKADLLCALLPRGPRAAVRISNRRDSGFKKGRLLRALFRALNHRFDWIVAPSRAALLQLAQDEGVRASRTRYQPNGVDTERFKPSDAADRGAHRLALGLPRDGFLFVCAARMEPVKRHQDLIEAFAIVARRHHDAGLVLIGTGPLEAALRQQVALAGLSARVHFLGKRADVERLLPLLDAFVLCSLTEGMSNAVLEAMACGLPVVATAVGGNTEAVIDGVTGLLVPPRAAARIGAAMLALIEDRARSGAWGCNARRQVGEAFSIAAMVERFELLYRDCRQPGAGP